MYLGGWGLSVAAGEGRGDAGEQQIEEAVEFAKNSPDPTPDQLMTDIYA